MILHSANCSCSWSYKICVLVAIGLLTTVTMKTTNALDEFMTCSRPTKQSRSSKQISLPCEGMELGKESWCSLPGPMYPWHAVRNFVFENQGLMRRMYGEVRQLSLLRMEFSGESNAIEPYVSAREFDDIFRPMTTNSLGPTPATTSSILNLMSTANSYVVHDDEFEQGESSESEPEISSSRSTMSAMSSPPSSSVSPTTAKSTSIPTSTTSASTQPSTTSASSSSVEVDIVNDANASSEKLTTLTQDEATTTYFFDGLIAETNPTEEMPSTMPTEQPQQPDKNEDSDSEEDAFVVLVQSDSSLNASKYITSIEPVQNNSNIHSDEKSTGHESEVEADAEKDRIEGQVLFQDFEKASPVHSPTPAAPVSVPAAVSTEERVRSRIGVNACPVKEEVVAPYWANNTRGEILALLNLYPFEQYIHWEKCTNEHRQMYCRDGCRCEQQYRLHRLLAFDPSNECRGIFSDWFRFPSCCVCKCYFEETPSSERISFNRSPREFDEVLPFQQLDGPDVNGVDDSHFFYKYHHSFRQPRK